MAYLTLCSLPCALAAQAEPKTSALADSIESRFATPSGYTRVAAEPGSFGAYLRGFPLKPAGSPVLLFDGRIKQSQVHAAVFDFPLLKRALIQCADAVIKLRAEYLYASGRADAIAFNLTNGMKVPLTEFEKGLRVAVAGNKTSWVGGGKKGRNRAVFEEYLAFIYAYAGTASLAPELKALSLSQIGIGDVFIVGGSPGHAVLVLDLATNARTGKKLMLLGQSYMPSQEFHLLKSGGPQSPWFSLEEGRLSTPEWVFPPNSLKRFQ